MTKMIKDVQTLPNAIKDEFEYYSSKIRDLPLLSPEEEARIIAKIGILRRYLVSELFHCPAAIKAFVEKLEAIHKQGVSFRRAFEWSVTFDKSIRVARPQIIRAMNRIRRCVDEIIRWGKLKVSPEQKRQQITRLCKACIQELGSLIIRTEVINDMIKHLEEISCKLTLEHDRTSQESVAVFEPVETFKARVSRMKRIAQELTAVKQFLANANVRLVISVSMQYRNRSQDLSLSDLIQEGNLGLLRAIERFRPQSGLKFSTYAVFWITQSIARTLEQKARMIRIPLLQLPVLTRLREAEQKLAQDLNRQADASAIAREINVPVKEVDKLLLMSRKPPSLNACNNDDQELSTIVEGADFTHKTIEEVEMKQYVEDMLKTLSPLQQTILRLRFGLDGGHNHSLRDVGKIFNVTGERIRQLECQALRRLRKTFSKEAVRAFLS